MSGQQLSALCQRAFLDGYHGEPREVFVDQQKQAYYDSSFSSGQAERAKK